METLSHFDCIKTASRLRRDESFLEVLTEDFYRDHALEEELRLFAGSGGLVCWVWFGFVWFGMIFLLVVKM